MTKKKIIYSNLNINRQVHMIYFVEEEVKCKSPAEDPGLNDWVEYESINTIR